LPLVLSLGTTEQHLAQAALLPPEPSLIKAKQLQRARPLPCMTDAPIPYHFHGPFAGLVAVCL